MREVGRKGNERYAGEVFYSGLTDVHFRGGDGGEFRLWLGTGVGDVDHCSRHSEKISVQIP